MSSKNGKGLGISAFQRIFRKFVIAFSRRLAKIEDISFERI